MKKTEAINKNAREIDLKSTTEILKLINQVDSEIPMIVKGTIPKLSILVEVAIKTLKSGGRIIYLGSGHSGDLCHSDAQETTGTFGVPFGTFRSLHLQLGPNHDWTVPQTVDYSQRTGREDGKAQFIADLKAISWSKKDLVIGVSASGETPVTIAALKWVHQNGGKTACIVSNSNSTMGQGVKYEVVAQAGAEIVSGSTRMKSGTITKMIINMFSTTTMIKMGNVYKGLMVGLQIGPKNDLMKFEKRALNIIVSATGKTAKEAAAALDETDQKTADKSKRSIKAAIVMLEKNIGSAKAWKLLNDCGGNIRKALQSSRS